MDGVDVQRCRFLPARWQTLTLGFGGVPAAVSKTPWRLLQLPLLLAAAAAATLRCAGAADVLHAHWLPNLLPLLPAARLRGTPRLVTLWGSDVEWYERSAGLRPAFRALLRRADGIVAINEHMRDLFEPLRRPDAALRLIPSGVDVELFRRRDKTPLRAELGLDEHALYIVSVASLIARKGADTAIRALADRSTPLRDIHLLLIGEGPERARLAALAAQLGVSERVHLRGEQTVARVADYMAAADIFVLPSHYEGRPNVVLEAQACGLPVVASDIPGCRDLIESGATGLLTPPGNIAALAEVFTALAADAHLRARLGDNARAAIHDRGLTWDACARRYADFYRDLGAAAA
jgi:glycosyltransferase involved in cell wall biosynthesis